MLSFSCLLNRRRKPWLSVTFTSLVWHVVTRRCKHIRKFGNPYQGVVLCTKESTTMSMTLCTFTAQVGASLTLDRSLNLLAASLVKLERSRFSNMVAMIMWLSKLTLSCTKIM